ncbi:hypothetical protein Tco_1393770 [Tanacetum coccineum]
MVRIYTMLVRLFMRGGLHLLSTLSNLMTSQVIPGSSSKRSLDSSLPSARPSRKRCRSPITLVPSSTPVSRSISPALADLPPRKRFRDSYSFEVSGEEHMEIGTADAETVADLGINDGVGAPTKDGTVNPLVTGGISEPTRGDAPDLEGNLYDISHYMSEVPLDMITEFKTAQRQLEAGQLVASEDRVGLADHVRSLGRENLRVRALLCIERDRVDSLRRHMALSQEEFRQIRWHTLNGNGNGNGRGNGNGNHNENDRDARPVVRECTYQDFMKCQPLNFKGTEGVVGLIRINDLAALLILKDSKSYMLWAPSWFSKEEDRVSEKFIGDFGGLPVNIRGITWIAAEPTRLQDAVRMANNLMDQS